MKKLNRKAKNKIKQIEWFIPNFDWNSRANIPGAHEYIEHGDGIDAELAFLDWTDRGIRHKEINGVARYLSLVEGLRRMTLQMTQWAEGFQEGTLFLSDFDNEPDYIKALANKALKSTLSGKFKHITPLGYPNEVVKLVMSNIIEEIKPTEN